MINHGENAGQNVHIMFNVTPNICDNQVYYYLLCYVIEHL